MLELGSLFGLLRVHLRLTQTEMAELLHISQPVYSRIEAGLRPVSMAILERIAAYVDVPVERLIGSFFLLDANLEAMERHAGDPVADCFVALAREYRNRFGARLKDAAALALLFDESGDKGASDHDR